MMLCRAIPSDWQCIVAALAANRSEAVPPAVAPSDGAHQEPLIDRPASALVIESQAAQDGDFLSSEEARRDSYLSWLVAVEEMRKSDAIWKSSRTL